MGVKVREVKPGKWYVIVRQFGRRRMFLCPSKREAEITARDVRKELNLKKWAPENREVATGIGALDNLGLPLKRYEAPLYPACIYFLCRRGEIVYVGQTTNLPRRVMNHFEDDGKQFDQVFYFPVLTKKKLKTTEAQLIAELKPKLNRNGLIGNKTALDGDRY